MAEIISLVHGSGGEATRSFIEHIVRNYLACPELEKLDDSAVVELKGIRLAFTTDSYVVDPIFFPGGDIGCLAVNGTVNDLAMVGATPLALTLGLIIEEGFPMEQVDIIMDSIRRSCQLAGVRIVSGDTKVVGHGSADKIFINTSGIGIVPDGVWISSSNAKPRDLILLSGSIGDHGIAVISKREGLRFTSDVQSDTSPLNGLVEAMLGITKRIHAMRDPTRGGLASALNEIARSSRVGMVVNEKSVPIKPEVKAACEMLGLDPFYVANEGKLVAFVDPDDGERLLEVMRRHYLGKDAAIIGEVTEEHPGSVVLKTRVGGKRLLPTLSGELLPRIC